MNWIYRSLLSLLFCTVLINSQAQQTAPPDESAQILHQNGQIYLVVLVLTTIFAGILFMLIRLERKLNKLEKSS